MGFAKGRRKGGGLARRRLSMSEQSTQGGGGSFLPKKGGLRDQMDSRVTVCAWATHYPSTPGESPDVTELLQATGWFCFRA